MLIKSKLNHYKNFFIIILINLNQGEEQKVVIAEPEKKKENIFDMNLDQVKKDLESSNYKEKNLTPKKEMGSEKVFYSTPRKSIPENLFHFNKQDSRYHQKLENQKLKKIVTLSDNDKSQFGSIDEIVSEFAKCFTSFSNEQILDSLKKNSFHLENTFLQLSNPKEFESKNDLIIFFLYKKILKLGIYKI